jgi:pyruvate/2-oxoglutarate dehydrogenase complex dihydrolipoamide dehydrogenase (E3) component
VAETARGRFEGTHLLVATGRSPNVEQLDLDAAGIRFDAGGVVVNAALRTSNRRIYAIGDVAAGTPNFTHVAGYHAGVVVRSILFGLPARIRTSHLPRVTYTDPELAQVGLTEAEAHERFGDRLEVVRAEVADNDRAITGGHGDGMIKVMVHRGRPVGVSIVSPGAGELIALWAVMLTNRLKMKAMSDTVLPYPTLAEIGKRATGAYFSAKLFDSPLVRKVVSAVQRHIP